MHFISLKKTVIIGMLFGGVFLPSLFSIVTTQAASNDSLFSRLACKRQPLLCKQSAQTSASSIVRTTPSLYFSLFSQPYDQQAWEIFRTSKRRGGGGRAPRTEATSSSSSQSPIAPTLSLGAMSKNFNSAGFTPVPTSNSNGSYTFTSSNLLVATVAGSVVTPVGAGTTTITVTQTASGNYTSGTTTATLTVAGACAVLSPCLNGGACTNAATIPSGALDTYTCSCPPGVDGQNCELTSVNCDGTVGTCNNGGTCVPSISGGSCACAACYLGEFCDIFDIACA